MSLTMEGGAQMDVKEAVRRATEHIKALYDEEGIRDVGLEEIVYEGDCWDVTIGFYRGWDAARSAARAPWKRRAYKVVRIRDVTGSVVSIKHRAFPEFV